MGSNDYIIELVSSFMSLCTAITTESSSTPDLHKADYHRLRQQLLNITGLPLPRWIAISTTPASVMAHVKSEKGTGAGTWALRRTYFQQEKESILASFISSEQAAAMPMNSALPESGYRIPVTGYRTPVAGSQPEESAVNPIRPPVNSATNENRTPLVTESAHYQPVAPLVNAKKKVFIVHGHNIELKYEVARLVDELGFKSIIFHEQPSRGSQTIIQKLIALTEDVDYAIVLYTACDIGRSARAGQEHPRARQNVVFEHGYLLSRLGPEKVMALREDGVEKPSDIDGVLYINVGNNWKHELSQELRSHL